MAAAGVLQEHVQEQRQRERHRDHRRSVIRVASGMLHDAAQRPDQGLGVAREPGGAGIRGRASRRRRRAGSRTSAVPATVRRRARCAAPQNRSIRCTSCVAITTVTPTSLKRLNSCMISSARSGSRLPVGSSAIRSGGFGDDRARDADALLLAGRELERQALLLAEQAHLVESRAHALVDFAPAA